MTLEQLRARMRSLTAEAKAIVDDADENNNGDFTKAQQTDFDAKMAEIDKVKGQIDSREKLEGAYTTAKESSGRTTGGQQIEVKDNPVAAETHGFDTMASFARAVQQACRQGASVDDRLNFQGAPGNYHRETGSAEGYLVPPQYKNEIMELVFNEPSLFNEVDSEPTNSNSVEMLADESTPWDGTGIQARWRDEGMKMEPTREKLGPRTVKLNELYAFTLATDELLEDAPRLQNRLTVKAAQAIRFKAAHSIMYGTGVGQPLGFMNSPALIVVPKVPSQPADSLLPENLADMYTRMLSSSLPRSKWLLNADLLPKLITMKLGDVPIYTSPNSGIKDAPGGMLLGRPVEFIDFAKQAGDLGDIMFIDPKGYYSPRKTGGIKYDSSIHLFFDYGIQAFRWTFRFGGTPHLSKPVAPMNGNTTRSHFVALAERA